MFAHANEKIWKYVKQTVLSGWRLICQWDSLIFHYTSRVQKSCCPSRLWFSTCGRSLNASGLASDGVHQCVDVNAGSCSRHTLHRTDHSHKNRRIPQSLLQDCNTLWKIGQHLAAAKIDLGQLLGSMLFLSPVSYFTLKCYKGPWMNRHKA